MKKNILIVEDNELNMKLMSDILEASNYNVTKAFDGEEALNLLQSKDFDLMLLDIHLPKKSGYEVLKESNKLVPIIVVSASCMDSDIQKAKELGCVDFISKPIKMLEFLEKIKSFFNI